MRSKIILFIIISFLCKGSFAQNLHLTCFSEANGLPSNVIRDVVEDSYGLFWIASDAGLLRFDGTNFKNYAKHIPSQYGRSFCRTPEGLLLSHDAGVSMIIPWLDTSMISPYIHGSINPDDKALYYPDRLFLRNNGDLLISQPGGRISRVSEGSVYDIVTLPELIENKEATAFFAEPEGGALWVAFPNGQLCIYNDTSKALEKVLKLPKINDLQLHSGEIWIAGEHIFKIELSGDGQHILNTETFHSELGEVTTLSLDSHGNIYLGIDEKGLYYLDRRKGRSPQFIKVFSNNNPHSVDKLPFKNIHKIVMESDDRLWICSSEGLGILQRRFFESLGTIPNANTTSICIAENGKIFVNFGDIYVIDRTELGFEGSLLQGFSGGTVTALAAANSHLWLGTSTGRIFRLNQEGKTLGSFDLRARGEGIFYMNYDSQSRLWICQAPEEYPLTGIGCLLPDGSLKEYGTDFGLESLVLCLHETSMGRIYCGGSGMETYLYRYLPDDDVFINLSLPLDFNPGATFAVHDLAVDSKGVVWLASTNGLLRYDMDRVVRVDLGNISEDIEIRAVCAMDDGSVWLSTDTKGIVRYSDTTSVILSEESGLPSEVMSYRCLVKEPGGRLWVGSSEGLVYSLDDNPKPRISNEPLLISAVLDGNSISTEGIRLFHDQQLTLEIVAPSYHGFRTFYQYSINGGEWKDLGTQRFIHLYDQEPGAYTMSIRSRKEGGYLWSTAIHVGLEVEQYWYRNPVFPGIFIILVIMGLVIYLINRRQRYSRNISMLTEGLQQEKKEIERKNAALEEAKDNMLHEQRQIHAHMLSMEIIHRMISKIAPGMKWDVVLEIISMDLLKFPNVIAFEIGTRKGKYIEFEGYSERVKSFTSSQIEYEPVANLASYTLNRSKPRIYNNIEEDSNRLLSKPGHRLDHYKSAISIPFYLENEPAIFSVYSDKLDLFDEYSLKTIQVFATYLEQII